MPAPTIFWNVDADGAWSTAADWNLSRLPNSVDDVAINTVHLHTVTHGSGSDSIHTLTVGNDNLTVSGGALRVVSTASFAHVLTVSAGSLIFDGAATAASFTQSHGTVSGNGSLSVTGAANFTGSLLQTSPGSTVLHGVSTLSGAGAQFGLDGGRTLENAGILNLTGTTQLVLGFNPFGTSLGGATLRNDAGATLDIQGSGLAISRGTGATTFSNAGTFEKTVGVGVATIGLAVSDTGAILVRTGALDVDGALTLGGSGSVEVSSGATLDLFGGGSGGAHHITVDSGGTLAFAGGVFSLNAADVEGPGGEVDVTAGSLAISGASQISGAFTVSGSGAVSLAAASSVVFNGGGSARADAFTVPVGSSLNFEFGTFALGPGAINGGGVQVAEGRLKVDGAVTLNGEFVQLKSTVLGAGALTLTGPAEFKSKCAQTGAGVTVLRGASRSGSAEFGLDGGRVLENQGVFTLTESGTIVLGDNPFGADVGGGTLRNDAGAVIDLKGANQILAALGVATFINAGLLRKSTTTGVAIIGVAVANEGAVKVTAGALDFKAAITGDGTLLVAGGATLEADGAAASTLTMSFVSGGATLALGDAASFAATIKGFASSDVLHLLSTAADAATLGGGDTLVITNGGQAVATLQLAGDFTGDTFSVVSDGAGGANITVETPGASKPDPVVGQRLAAAMARQAPSADAAMHPGHIAPPHPPMLAAPRIAFA